MPIISRLGQLIQKSTFNSKIRVRVNTNFSSYLIRYLKTDTINIFCQTIGIFPKNTINSIFVSFVYFIGKTHGNSVLLQKNHCLAKIPFFLYLFRNRATHFLTNSLHFTKAFRFLFHNTKSILFKSSDNSGCQCCTNSLNDP